MWHVACSSYLFTYAFKRHLPRSNTTADPDSNSRRTTVQRDMRITTLLLSISVHSISKRSKSWAIVHQPLQLQYKT